MLLLLLFIFYFFLLFVKYNAMYLFVCHIRDERVLLLSTLFNLFCFKMIILRFLAAPYGLPKLLTVLGSKRFEQFYSGLYRLLVLSHLINPSSRLNQPVRL